MQNDQEVNIPKIFVINLKRSPKRRTIVRPKIVTVLRGGLIPAND